MPNTVVQTTLAGGANSRLVVRHITIISDGTQETNLVVYDNSAFRNDPLRGCLLQVQASGSSCVCRLAWQQTTDFVATTVNPGSDNGNADFRLVGGVSNPGATGATGDLRLTTIGLASGDAVTLVITVRQ